MALNWRIIALTGITAFVEGFDVQLIGYIAPSVSKEWALERGAFGPIFAASAVGMMIGSTMLAPITDKIGRKWTLVASTIFYGLFTLLNMFVHDVPEFLVVRFLTGIGVGCALPNAIALSVEFNPVQRRALVSALVLCFFGIGSALAGLVSAGFIEDYGWRFVLLVGALMTLALVPLLAAYLPESRYFLDSRSRTDLQKKAANSVAELFSEGRARVTLCLWVIFPMSLMLLYFLASWLPTAVEDQGLPLSFAVLTGSLFQIGGIAGSLVWAPMVDRLGPSKIMAVAYLLAAFSTASVGYVSESMIFTGFLVFLAGFGVIGAQNVANGTTAKFYPTRIRATGLGWALGLGRIGPIAGPLIGGFLLAQHYEVKTLFLFAAIPAVIAACAFLFVGKRPEFAADAKEPE